MRTGLRLLVAMSLMLSAKMAMADLTANIGWASDYFYRGVLQAPTSASAGIDLEHNGFYVGTWAADVKDGLEVDGFLGYTVEMKGISCSIGCTGYYYTGEFDDTYREINLGLGYGYATFELAVGEYDNFGGGTQVYTYYALTLGKNGFYGKVAGFAEDFQGEYLELGYGTTVAELDIGVAALLANRDLVGEPSESLVFTIGKSFDIN